MLMHTIRHAMTSTTSFHRRGSRGSHGTSISRGFSREA